MFMLVYLLLDVCCLVFGLLLFELVVLLVVDVCVFV